MIVSIKGSLDLGALGECDVEVWGTVFAESVIITKAVCEVRIDNTTQYLDVFDIARRDYEWKKRILERFRRVKEIEDLEPDDYGAPI